MRRLSSLVRLGGLFLVLLAATTQGSEALAQDRCVERCKSQRCAPAEDACLRTCEDRRAAAILACRKRENCRGDLVACQAVCEKRDQRARPDCLRGCIASLSACVDRCAPRGPKGACSRSCDPAAGRCVRACEAECKG